MFLIWRKRLAPKEIFDLLKDFSVATYDLLLSEIKDEDPDRDVMAYNHVDFTGFDKIQKLCEKYFSDYKWVFMINKDLVPASENISFQRRLYINKISNDINTAHVLQLIKKDTMYLVGFNPWFHSFNCLSSIGTMRIRDIDAMKRYSSGPCRTMRIDGPMYTYFLNSNNPQVAMLISMEQEFIKQGIPLDQMLASYQMISKFESNLLILKPGRANV